MPFSDTNTGVIIEEPKVQDWLFGSQGSMIGDVFQIDGQWLSFVPTGEKQLNKWFNSFGCVSFSALNCLEILYKRKYGEDINFSDRYTVVASGTVPLYGNSLRAVAESLRVGFVYEDILPFNAEMSQDEYYTPLSAETRLKGATIASGYIVQWEWIGRTQANMLEALKYAPLQIIIAFSRKDINQDGIYERVEWELNHAVTLIGYELNKFWIVLDSMDGEIKRLAWDYKMDYPLRFSFRKKEELKYGELVKTATSPKIYFVGRTGRIAWIPDEKSFKSLWGEFTGIKTVDYIPTNTLTLKII